MTNRRSHTLKIRSKTTLNTILSLAAVVGIGIFFSHYKIEGLENVRIARRSSATAIYSPNSTWNRFVPDWDRTTLPNTPSSDNVITIASFNVQAFGKTKLGKPHVMQVLSQLLRQFDVIALQEIRSKDQLLLPKFVEMINDDGACYAHTISPRLGRTINKEQYAFVYNTANIELDKRWVYVVRDPHDSLHHEPFVARFRALGPPLDEAFRFMLVNIHIDPDTAAQELDVLDDVFVTVSRAAGGEDDVILLGDLNTNEHELGQLGQLPNIAWAISGIATNTRGNKVYDNIIFDAATTVEYTGRAGVLNFREMFDLTMEQALSISDHMPVWAEFCVMEGGQRRGGAHLSPNTGSH